MKGMRGTVSLSNWKEGTVYQDGEDCKRTKSGAVRDVYYITTVGGMASAGTTKSGI